MKNKLPSIDLLTLLLALSISTIGLIFVLSSSYIWAEYKFDDAFYFFKRQLLFAAIGVVGMIAISRIDYQIYKKYATPFLFTSLVLLILVSRSRNRTCPWRCTKLDWNWSLFFTTIRVHETWINYLLSKIYE